MGIYVYIWKSIGRIYIKIFRCNLYCWVFLWLINYEKRKILRKCFRVSNFIQFPLLIILMETVSVSDDSFWWKLLASVMIHFDAKRGLDVSYCLTGLPRSTNLIGSNQPTKSDRIPGCGPTFGSLVLESDGILVSEFDGTYRWVLIDLYY